jgi:hypothetical protein
MRRLRGEVGFVNEWSPGGRGGEWWAERRGSSALVSVFRVPGTVLFLRHVDVDVDVVSLFSLSLSLVSYMLRDTPTCISPTRRHELAFFLSASRGLA